MMLIEAPGRHLVQRLTLADYFAQFTCSSAVYLRYDNGYRNWSYSYSQVEVAARLFSATLRAQGIGKGDKVLFWSENRPEWVAAFWGCVVAGAIVVPIDYRASVDFLKRVQEQVSARAILIGDEVRLPAWSTQPPVYEIVRQIRSRRISLAAVVPKLLEVLREHILQQFPEAAEPPPAGTHWTRRWCRYRRIHRYFGFKFWVFITGAAPLEAELEEFWSGLGFLVVRPAISFRDCLWDCSRWRGDHHDRSQPPHPGLTEIEKVRVLLDIKYCLHLAAAFFSPLESARPCIAVNRSVDGSSPTCRAKHNSLSLCLTADYVCMGGGVDLDAGIHVPANLRGVQVS